MARDYVLKLLASLFHYGTRKNFHPNFFCKHLQKTIQCQTNFISLFFLNHNFRLLNYSARLDVLFWRCRVREEEESKVKQNCEKYANERDSEADEGASGERKEKWIFHETEGKRKKCKLKELVASVFFCFLLFPPSPVGKKEKRGKVEEKHVERQNPCRYFPSFRIKNPGVYLNPMIHFDICHHDDLWCV
jgi:hypothetical protein